MKAMLQLPDVLSFQIWRVENENNFHQYCVKRKGNTTTSPLWHGTTGKSVKLIAESKFDRGVASKNLLQHKQIYWNVYPNL